MLDLVNQIHLVVFLKILTGLFLLFFIKRLIYISVTRLIQEKISHVAYKIFKKERIIKRANTIGSLLSSLIMFMILITSIWFLAEAFNISLAPILASVSVVGIIVGLGMQQIIRDFISGIFIIIEDQFGIGDQVEIDKINGKVTNIGLRITEIIDCRGVTWYVRNGEITKIGNYSQKNYLQKCTKKIEFNENHHKK